MKLHHFLLLSLLLLAVPHSAGAKELSDLYDLYNDSIRLEQVNANDILKIHGKVLGASTDTSTKISVTKDLDSTYKSYFEDISFKGPKGWYYDEDYDETSIYSYISDPAYQSDITIERFNAEDTNQKELGEYIEEVCDVCGYKVKDTGSIKLGKQKANYVDASNGKSHLKFIYFIKSDVGYIITLYATETAWPKYKGILEKSAKTVKIL